MATTVALGRVRWSHGLSYNISMLEYKVINFPPWLFSTMSNSAIGRKTLATDSHRWQTLPWLCLLWRLPWTIQATSEWRKERQWIDSRSVGRVIWIHRLSYDRSMIEYEVVKFPPWLFSTMPNSTIGRKTHAPDSHRWQPLPWLCLLRLRSWIIQAITGATVGLKAEATTERHQEWQQRQRSNNRATLNW